MQILTLTQALTKVKLKDLPRFHLRPAQSIQSHERKGDRNQKAQEESEGKTKQDCKGEKENGKAQEEAKRARNHFYSSRKNR